MCACNPSIRRPYCGQAGCEWPLIGGYDEAPGKDKTVIEINFPLDGKALLKIITGCEWSLLTNIQNGPSIRVKIFTTDRKKTISFDNWRKIRAAALYNHELSELLNRIELEDE